MVEKIDCVDRDKYKESVFGVSFVVKGWRLTGLLNGTEQSEKFITDVWQFFNWFRFTIWMKSWICFYRTVWCLRLVCVGSCPIGWDQRCLAMLVSKQCDTHVVGDCRLGINSGLAECVPVTLTFICLFCRCTYKSITDSGLLNMVGWYASRVATVYYEIYRFLVLWCTTSTFWL